MQKIYQIVNTKFYSESGHKRQSLWLIKLLCHSLSLFFATYAASTLFENLDIDKELLLFFGVTLALVLEFLIYKSGGPALLTLAELIQGKGINRVEDEAKRINAFFRAFMALIYLSAFTASAILTITGAKDKATEWVDIPKQLSRDSLNQIVNHRFDSAMTQSLSMEVANFERLSQKDATLLEQINRKQKDVDSKLRAWNRCIRKNGKEHCWTKHSQYRNAQRDLDKLHTSQQSTVEALAEATAILNAGKTNFRDANYKHFNTFMTDQMRERADQIDAQAAKQSRYKGWAKFTGVICQSFIFILELLLLLIPFGNGQQIEKEPGYLDGYSPLLNRIKVYLQRQKIKAAIRIAHYSRRPLRVKLDGKRQEIDVLQANQYDPFWLTHSVVVKEVIDTKSDSKNDDQFDSILHTLFDNENDSDFDSKKEGQKPYQKSHQNGYHSNGVKSQLLTNTPSPKVISEMIPKVMQKMIAKNGENIAVKNGSNLLSKTLSKTVSESEEISINENVSLFKQGRWYVILYTDTQTDEQKTYSKYDIDGIIAEYKAKIRKKRSKGKTPLPNHIDKLAYFESLANILKAYNSDLKH